MDEYCVPAGDIATQDTPHNKRHYPPLSCAAAAAFALADFFFPILRGGVVLVKARGCDCVRHMNVGTK